MNNLHSCHFSHRDDALWGIMRSDTITAQMIGYLGWGMFNGGVTILTVKRTELEQVRTSLPFAACLNNESCHTVCGPRSPPF